MKTNHTPWTFILVAIIASGLPAPATLAATPDRARPPAFGAAYIPSAESEVLQEVPSSSDPIVREMSGLRKQLDATPADYAVADRLAREYIDYGRQVGDAHYAGYAEAVIAPWIAKSPPPVPVLVLQATILQFRHQFSEARVLLRTALARDRDNAQAWLTLATLDMVQGEYPIAAQDCAEVNRVGGNVLGIACSGNLRSYIGQARQSIALLNQVADDAPSLPKPFKAWIQGLLAESCERLGSWDEAELHYRKALAYTPGDNYLLVGYADFLLDRGRASEVPPLLEQSAQSDTAFLRIALAEAELKSPATTRDTWIMAARFEALAQRGSDYFGREQVRFALHLQNDPTLALELATRNWQVQRAPWDVRVLLEAALGANQPGAAVPVLQFVEETKLQDPVIDSLARQLRSQLKSGPAATS
ncbi:MAG: hypothetical protein ABSF50_14150 [Burkholderiaceae bacterium]|jgi:tetratricopeptide (TPR) repeat protein